jgi:formate dehydrogenase accessory protein FdhE
VATAADARIVRAGHLASAVPAASRPLTFYVNLLDLQSALLDTYGGVIRPSASFADALDFEAAADALPGLLTALTGIAPPVAADAARKVLQEGHAEWRHLLHTYWTGERDGDPLREFIAEALLQPFAETVAAGRPVPAYANPPAEPAHCPVCDDRPVAAVLREAAHGAKRSFVCGFCLTEWSAPRIGCAGCAERTFEQLAVYRAEEFAGARVDACETCHTYLKTIDMTRDGKAVPVVDDIATLTLDVWAREHGYTRLRANLLRL